MFGTYVYVCVVNRQNGLSLVCHTAFKQHYHQQYDNVLKSPLTINPIHQTTSLTNWNSLLINSNSSSSTSSTMYII
jgi:methyltransferase-like protein